MGMIYRPKYKRPDGARAESKIWWLKFYRNGKPIRESTDTTDHAAARRMLKAKEGDVAKGVPLTPHTGRVRYGELRDDVVTDYDVNGKRSIEDVKRRFKHLDEHFEGRRASLVTTADVRKYVQKRQEASASNAQINRELSALKRAFSLGSQAGKVMFKPHIPMLREDNVRTGFFDVEKFKAVRALLSPALQPVVTFAFLTGWRVPSEILTLRWRQVDFEGGTVRLDAGTTKNGDGRVFPMTAELRELLEAQRAHREAVQRERGEIIPHVFHRSGKQIKGFRRTWKSACDAAGCPGMILHDFRRTAVRNLVRAGIPERVAMTMTGHKTRSVFERYNIVSEGDLAAAAERLDQLAGKVPGKVDTQTAAVAGKNP
jgi:integrase